MIIDITGLIVFGVYTLLLVVLIIQTIRLSVKNKRLFAESVQLQLDKLSIYTKLEEISDFNDNKSIEQTEGFLRFVSESRDWAFEYIENVQQALAEYDEALHTKEAAKINTTYKNLIDFLPKEEDDGI